MIDARGVTIACPSTNLCVGVVTADQPGTERLLAFAPKSGRILRTWQVQPDSLNSVTCASTTECTAVGAAVGPTGWELTWNPQTTGTVAILSSAQIPFPGALHAVSCPVVWRCSAIAGYGASEKEVTFDPRLGTANSAGARPLGGYGPDALSCPSAGQCTAVDQLGEEVTYDTDNGNANAAGVTSIDPGQALTGVSCPTASQCTAVDLHGNEVTFDPTSGTVNAAGVQPVHTDATDYSVAVACPTASQCTSVGEGGTEATFTPPDGAASATVIDRGRPLVAISCATAQRCVAIDDSRGFRLDRGSKTRASSPQSIDSNIRLKSVSCPSATQCTAVDFHDHNERTFNPLTGHINSAGTPAIDPTGHPTSVSCPTTTKCVAVDLEGQEVTFNPLTGKTVAAIGQLGFNTGTSDHVSCPSASQCTAVNDESEVTFNPTKSGIVIRSQASFYNNYGMQGIDSLSCPSLSECVVVGTWDELAFRPASGTVLTGERQTIGPVEDLEQLNGVACSSPRYCIAVDQGGGAETFNPTVHGGSTRRVIAQAGTLKAISCVRKGPCVAVDDAGNAFVAAP